MSVGMEKSEAFAIRVVKLCKYLRAEKKEYDLSNQILRSGTSIGANLAEAECAVSKNDFTSKVYIALKEASETDYWLRLLYKTDYISHEQFESLHNDCIEIKRILSATTKTLSEANKK